MLTVWSAGGGALHGAGGGVAARLHPQHVAGAAHLRLLIHLPPKRLPRAQRAAGQRRPVRDPPRPLRPTAPTPHGASSKAATNARPARDGSPLNPNKP
eukprot:1180143-Prorocentrum_minimum.AAC.3